MRMYAYVYVTNNIAQHIIIIMFITYNIIIIDGKQSLRKGRAERVRLRYSIHLYKYIIVYTPYTTTSCTIIILYL